MAARLPTSCRHLLNVHISEHFSALLCTFSLRLCAVVAQCALIGEVGEAVEEVGGRWLAGTTLLRFRAHQATTAHFSVSSSH